MCGRLECGRLECGRPECGRPECGRLEDGRPKRLRFIDNLRWSAVSMVVVMHAAVTYSPFGGWYFQDRGGTGRTAEICFATYQAFQHAVAMGLLFGIAGFFAQAALERKQPPAFLRERAFRLGLPLLLYTLLIGPATEYFVAGSWHSAEPTSFMAQWWNHVASPEVFSESGPLWFCLVLLVFSAGFAVLRLIRPPATAGRAPDLPGVRTVLRYAGVMAAVTFAVGLEFPTGHPSAVNVDLHDLPQYPMMFAAGVLAHRGNWPARFSARAGRAWLVGGLSAAAVGWCLIVSLGGALQGNVSAYAGGLHWQAAALDLWRSCTCLSLTIGLITLYRDRFDRHGPVSVFLTRNAFGVYVLHPPILVAATRIVQLWPADVAVKFLAASLLGIIGTFLFVGMIVRRTPGLRAII